MPAAMLAAEHLLAVFAPGLAAMTNQAELHAWQMRMGLGPVCESRIVPFKFHLLSTLSQALEVGLKSAT